VSGRDRRIDAIEVRVNRLPPVRAEARRETLRLTIRPPDAGTAEEVREWARCRNAALWRASRTLRCDEGLAVHVTYAEWREPVLVADEVMAPGAVAPRAEPSLAAPPAPRALLAPPPPPEDAVYCARCGYAWTAHPRPNSDPCPAGCGRTTWNTTPPLRRGVGGFAITL
jgi:hypothetical protein